MRLKLYRAASVGEAMALVRAELGPEALILSTRRLAQGVELTAALEPEETPPFPPAIPPRPAPERPDSSHGLAFHGIPAFLSARLAGPDLAGSLRAVLRFGVLPLVRDGPPLLFAGMPGAGKTLSVARLATRLVLDGVSPLVISADGRRAGAAEELAAYTRLLGIGLVVASTPSTLARALAQRQPDMPVLIDTPGINPFAEPELAGLLALAAAARPECVLVMPAGQDVAEATDQAAAFAPLGARHLLPTRLDLSRRLGSVLAVAASCGLVLTEAGTGTGAADGLTPLTPEFLAAWLAPPAEPARQPAEEPVHYPAPWKPGPPQARKAARTPTDWTRG